MSTLDDVDWPVRTERLTIRRATPDDLEATWAFRRLESVARWIASWPRTLEEYATSYSDPDRMASTLVVERDGEVVGDLMLEIGNVWSQTEVVDRARGRQAELGWTFHPDHGGRGHATEAVAELIRLGFEELGLHRVVALCFADNTASWRLMERLGLRREQHNVQDSLHRELGWLDGFGYALLAEEWRRRS
jgi:RimJ/RimL family protein N-acetyltransferase